MLITSKLLRFCRRQIHTIVSRDIIKPSSPTPSHSKTYNLAFTDQLAVNAFIPVIVLYPSSSVYQSSHDKTLELKNSLSQTLTSFYPFAGRMKYTNPTFVDCNDEGVVFIEASNTSSLSNFLQQREYKDLDQLFPDDLICFKSNHKYDEKSSICPLAVQVSHFACGGVAVAISLSHKICDASSTLNFLKHWAAVNHKDTTSSSIVNPNFISHEHKTCKALPSNRYPLVGDHVTQTFVFSNAKLNDLKAKVTTMTIDSKQPITNPTRLEVLTWLIFKCKLAASKKTKSLAFKNNIFLSSLNLRDKLKEKLPETTIGNLVGYVVLPISNNHDGDVVPDEFINELRRTKLKVKNLRNLEAFFDRMKSEVDYSEGVKSYYLFSSICGFPLYTIDFGWGKPIKATIYCGTSRNFTLLLDTPDGNGKALKLLPKTIELGSLKSQRPSYPMESICLKQGDKNKEEAQKLDK
ncbi:epi-neemfruitin B synthase L1AT-like [Rutidosis leptorrhynchoides]|uniref:epi-neemfruitin B synthase L1AT-like n=1 Tax=Rutidosis leptorrhynchoides TaxID=125765 RepID=UPI003A99C28F